MKLIASLLVISAAYLGIPPPSPQLLKTGQTLYAAGCAACHGAGGEGNGPVAFAVKPPPRNLVKDPFKAGDRLDQVYATVTNGLANTKMVGYPQLKDEERWALAYWVLALRSKK